MGTCIPEPYPKPWRIVFWSINFISEGSRSKLNPCFTIRISVWYKEYHTYLDPLTPLVQTPTHSPNPFFYPLLIHFSNLASTTSLLFICFFFPFGFFLLFPYFLFCNFSLLPHLQASSVCYLGLFAAQHHFYFLVFLLPFVSLYRLLHATSLFFFFTFFFFKDRALAT